jgi:hypothetical protein
MRNHFTPPLWWWCQDALPGGLSHPEALTTEEFCFLDPFRLVPTSQGPPTDGPLNSQPSTLNRPAVPASQGLPPVPTSPFSRPSLQPPASGLQPERCTPSPRRCRPFDADAGKVENDVRPSAVGKKRWLFIGHPEAGWRTAVIYTMIRSCRRYGINPQEYLTDVLQRLPAMTTSQVPELLPVQWRKARQARGAEVP